MPLHSSGGWGREHRSTSPNSVPSFCPRSGRLSDADVKFDRLSQRCHHGGSPHGRNRNCISPPLPQEVAGRRPSTAPLPGKPDVSDIAWTLHPGGKGPRPAPPAGGLFCALRGRRRLDARHQRGDPLRGRSSAERTAALDGWLWDYKHRRRPAAIGHRPPVGRTNVLGSYGQPPIETIRTTIVQITRNSIETAAGPSGWFTGAVYVDTVATPSGPSRLSASCVHSRRAHERRGTPTRTARPSTSPRASASRSGAAARSR